MVTRCTTAVYEKVDPLTEREQAWLPNLAGGVSVWNLAEDLNRAPFFDGRLLVPIVHGPANLPTHVEWDLSGLMPLGEARAKHAGDLDGAIAEFARRAERAAELFGQSGYEKFRAAFTLPSLEADGGAHWFFDPHERKLCVKNWGASPRDVAQRTEHVLGHRRFVEVARAKGGKSFAAGSPSSAERPRRRWWLLLAPILLLVCAAPAIYLAWPAAPRVDPPAHEPDPPPISIDAGSIAIEPPPLPAPHQKIYFEVGEDQWHEDQLESLSAIHAYLSEHSQVRRLLIEGHADFVGQEPDNEALSGHRASRVRQWLIDSGIEEERLLAAACSELYPLSPNETDEGRRANRRVELFVIDPPIEPAPHAGCRPLP